MRNINKWVVTPLPSGLIPEYSLGDVLHDAVIAEWLTTTIAQIPQSDKEKLERVMQNKLNNSKLRIAGGGNVH